MTVILNAAGGLGIFLLAMAMLTGGLKAFGGERLKHHLEHWTSTPLRGVATGALVTALVQSSSAVTIATIGFVNAGVLSLRHALGVIFGANVGTTVTGWLVSLVGFDFKIEVFALPIIALGVGLRIAARSKRINGLGDAVAGFGLFFLGLSILKEAFAGTAASFGTATLSLAGAGVEGVALFLLIGLVATVLTQSSSAAIALILTAASESALGLGAAAAAIIGANVGTTSTAAFSVIGATPNAKRVAAGHILFNLLTGIAALAMLPLLLWAASELGHLLGLSDRPVIVLALFHTVFNIVGIALLLPFVGTLTSFLSHHFTNAEEDISRPRHLDRTVAATAAFALPALIRELNRLRDLVCTTGLAAIAGQESRSGAIQRRAEAMRLLGQAVSAFAVEVRMEGMSRTDSEALARLLRGARYLDESATLLADIHAANQAAHRLSDEATRREVLDLLASAQTSFTLCNEKIQDSAWRARLEASLGTFESLYQQAKSAILRAAAVHLLSIEGADTLLDALSHSRRMVEQTVKASLLLAEEGHTTTIPDNKAAAAAVD